MEPECDASCCIDDLVDAALAFGSDYRALVRRNAPVTLDLEKATGKVIVIRAGALKVGYVIGPYAEKIASCLAHGYCYAGRIEDVALGPGGKVLRLRLHTPTR